MPNYLKMPKKAQVLALLELEWNYRRIEAETGVRRETVSRYDRMRRANAAKTFPGSAPAPSTESHDLPPAEGSNAAKTFAGSDANPAKTFLGSTPRPRFTAAVYRTAIAEKLDAGLSLQRVWQDLVEEYGYGASYESVKRFVPTLAPTRRAVGVFHCAPGAEGQVDFFRGATTLDAGTGEWRRPWLFRMTLGHSRHGYEEAVWDQKLETFLRLHERAFRDLGGVPTVIRHDNLKAAVVRACFFDPDSHHVYLAFAHHWGFTPLPTQPRTPQENGKQERSGGYVKGNALKGRTFDIRVALRQLGGEQDAPPVTPPWFLPGAEAVWQRIAETERALRAIVREVYVARFGDSAAAKIEAAVPERDRQTLGRNLARRPAGAEPLSIIDYLYLGQLPAILFAQDVQQEARSRFRGVEDPKQRLLAAVSQIAPVRNEIAHVREIDRDRLLRASVACADVLEMLKGNA